MSQEVIVTCAVTGGHANFHKHPNYPITPKQIASPAWRLAARVPQSSTSMSATPIRVCDPVIRRSSGR